MDNSYDYSHQLRALAMRVAALEDNVAFLEHWCEEQQDVLDRAAGPVAYDYERVPVVRQILRVVDLREGVVDDEDAEDSEGDVDTIVALVETDHDRRVRQLQAKLNRLRSRLALSVAPPAETTSPPPPPRTGGRRISVKPASRTAP